MVTVDPHALADKLIDWLQDNTEYSYAAGDPKYIAKVIIDFAASESRPKADSIVFFIDCQRCGGMARPPGQECPRCNGTGHEPG